MIDLNDAPLQSELFQQYGVDDYVQLRAKFPDFFPLEEDEQEAPAILQPRPAAAVAQIDAGGLSRDGRYVNTSGIKSAVQGHELAVLGAVGIDWNGSRGHIDCPYPRHGGKSDWRWDADRKQAFCTCMGKDGDKKAHSIFDVVMHVAGLDFESAKLRIAEIIGRRDLIRITRGKQAAARYQRTDAASLLSPPPDNRDDTLPWLYLGARLGIDPDSVPRPTTRVVGLKELAYFDPPAGEDNKPVPVATAPCAVFEQVDRDGRQHAHRIYLALDGRGKADLGLKPDGEPRDPKKSARKVGNDSTVGRSVLWGNPDTAALAIASEGIENAAAVALAFHREIEDGQVLVASCISAAGLGAFRPWPATRKLIVAADRDEGIKEDGRPRDQTGEQAARTLCRQLEGIVTGIALPGMPGEKVDWLDILRRDGVDAVRNGILDTRELEPTDEERWERQQAAELREIRATYPLPLMETLRLEYARTGRGVMVCRVVKREEGLEYIPVATPFGVTKRLRHADQYDAYGLRCLVQDMNNRPRAVDFDRALLAKMGASEIRALLFAAGLRIEGDGDNIAVQALKAADPAGEIIVVGRPGYHQVAGCPDPIFVAPSGAIIGAPVGVDLELAASTRMAPEVATAGTLDGWRDAIAAAVSVDGCPHWNLGVLAGLAGVLISLTGLPSCGINLSGMTTSGKSTAQRLAVSFWSTPDIRRGGLLASASTTDNAVEATFHRGTGTVAALDELALVNGKFVERLAFMLGSGTGKRRMNVDASLRDSYTWSTFAFLSCESGLEEKVRREGGIWRGGMAARVLDIDVTGVNRQVDAPILRAIDAVEQHYGHAGPAFVTAVAENGLHRQALALRDRILKAAKVLAGGDDADGANVRAATPLAVLLIAGELAVNFGILPAEVAVKETVQWAWDRFRRSAEAEALDPQAQAISHLQQWIHERWDVTIKKTAAPDGVTNREAVAWYDDTAVYLPKARISEAAGGALKEREIGAALDAAELLARKPEKDRYTVRTVPQIGKLDAYALSRRAFGRSVSGADFGYDFNDAPPQRRTASDG